MFNFIFDELSIFTLGAGRPDDLEIRANSEIYTGNSLSICPQ